MFSKTLTLITTVLILSACQGKDTVEQHDVYKNAWVEQVETNTSHTLARLASLDAKLLAISRQADELTSYTLNQQIFNRGIYEAVSTLKNRLDKVDKPSKVKE
ncbi:hypothetical protein KKH23_04435 [Patescibacteria group bacterium]|nr:hypothetical protein [Patescibacteria group bacterium]